MSDPAREEGSRPLCGVGLDADIPPGAREAGNDVDIERDVVRDSPAFGESAIDAVAMTRAVVTSGSTGA